MKLGQEVSFSKSLSKQTGYFVDYANLTKEEACKLEDDGFITLIRFKEREHNKKTGFVCGKRFITTKGILEEVEGHRDWNLVQTDATHEEVYVVACDMRGLYRVRAEDLEDEFLNRQFGRLLNELAQVANVTVEEATELLLAELGDVGVAA